MCESTPDFHIAFALQQCTNIIHNDLENAMMTTILSISVMYSLIPVKTYHQRNPMSRKEIYSFIIKQNSICCDWKTNFTMFLFCQLFSINNDIMQNVVIQQRFTTEENNSPRLIILFFFKTLLIIWKKVYGIARGVKGHHCVSIIVDVILQKTILAW